MTHPLVRLVEVLEHALAQAQGAAAWTLSPNQLTDLLPRLDRVGNAVEAHALSLLREADRHQVGDASGAANTAGWWANTTRTTKQDAHRQVALAARLDDDTHAPTATALGRGAVSVDQAAVILNAVDALPTDLVGPALRRDAEEHLLALAVHHDPRELRLLGRRILDVIAPEISEDHERKVLESEERNAAATASFTMNPDGHGSMIGRFKIPTLAGEMLRKHLNALAAPKHRATSTETPLVEEVAQQPSRNQVAGRVARPLRLGQAFTEYIETRAAQGTPKAGGLAATVVVTIGMDTLLGASTAATLESGERISASEARRMVCEAGIYPMVLGTDSQILDLGRKTRFHTEPQRIVITQRDKGCNVEGCDWPPELCHVHHPDAWETGGATSVENGMLICPRHHTIAHDNRYQLKAGKNGRVIFSRRP